jgi:hypothetical protein
VSRRAAPHRWQLVCVVAAVCLTAGLPLHAAAAGGLSATEVPAGDSEVVEVLRDRPLSAEERQWRAMRAQLRAQPRSLKLATDVAWPALRWSRRDGDPRLLGQAQAALAPWWGLRDPPPEVRLLRLAEAGMAMDDVLARRLATTQVAALRAKFEAAHLRGDQVHRREEARLALRLLHQPQRALQLARANWQVQKEPADARVLLEAARAVQDKATVASLRSDVQHWGWKDQRLEALW